MPGEVAQAERLRWWHNEEENHILLTWIIITREIKQMGNA
jgi:hypothetical protein